MPEQDTQHKSQGIGIGGGAQSSTKHHIHDPNVILPASMQRKHLNEQAVSKKVRPEKTAPVLMRSFSQDVSSAQEKTENTKKAARMKKDVEHEDKKRDKDKKSLSRFSAFQSKEKNNEDKQVDSVPKKETPSFVGSNESPKKTLDFSTHHIPVEHAEDDTQATPHVNDEGRREEVVQPESKKIPPAPKPPYAKGTGDQDMFKRSGDDLRASLKSVASSQKHEEKTEKKEVTVPTENQKTEEKKATSVSDKQKENTEVVKKNEEKKPESQQKPVEQKVDQKEVQKEKRSDSLSTPKKSLQKEMEEIFPKPPVSMRLPKDNNSSVAPSSDVSKKTQKNNEPDVLESVLFGGSMSSAAGASQKTEDVEKKEEKGEKLEQKETPAEAPKKQADPETPKGEKELEKVAEKPLMTSKDEDTKQPPKAHSEPPVEHVEQKAATTSSSVFGAVTSDSSVKKNEAKPQQEESKTPEEKEIVAEPKLEPKPTSKPKHPLVHVSSDELRMYKKDVARIGRELELLETELKSVISKKERLVKEKADFEKQSKDVVKQLENILKEEEVYESRIHELEQQELTIADPKKRRELEEKRWKQEDGRAEVQQRKWDIQELHDKADRAIDEKDSDIEHAETTHQELVQKIEMLTKERNEKKAKVRLGEVEEKKHEIEDIQVALLEEKRRLDRLYKTFEVQEKEMYEKRRSIQQREKGVVSTAQRKELEQERRVVERKQREAEEKRWEAEQTREKIMEKLEASNKHYATIEKIEIELQRKIGTSKD